MKQIPINKGYVVLVDDADYERVSRWKWKALVSKRKNGPPTIYAYRSKWKNKAVYMHRLILGCEQHVDHKDGNGLNNQRSNLRPATMSQNIANRAKLPGCSSRYKGVCWHFGLRRWQVHIHKDGKSTYLGSAVEEWEGALMYNEAAIREFGEFAWLNKKLEDCA